MVLQYFFNQGVFIVWGFLLPASLGIEQGGKIRHNRGARRKIVKNVE